MPPSRVTPLPFHYTAIIRELTEGLEKVLHASDWHEGDASGIAPDDKLRYERSNAQVAITHILNAYTALERRHDDLFTAMKLYEHDAMSRPGVASDLAAVKRAEATATPLKARTESDTSDRT